jgi:hypothetical protein
MSRLNLLSLVLLFGAVPGIFTGLMVAAWLLHTTELVGLLIGTVTILAYWVIGTAYLFRLTRT